MLAVNNLSMHFGSKVLFKDLSLQFLPGCRYGLVGANGSGKTTFLKILSREVEPGTGQVVYISQSRVATLKQDHFLYEEETLLDTVLMGNTLLWKAQEQKKLLLTKARLEQEDHERLAQLEERIAEQDGYSAESEAAKLLEGLGMPKKLHRDLLKTLSGGYKLRVLLAQVLFSKPDVLLMDEPTNHLDLFSIKWLENYLREFEGVLIVSSHDRHFLNSVVTHIADVDYGSIRIYKGDYEQFKLLKEQERDQAELRLSHQEKRRDQMQEFITRFKAKASKARQAQSRMRMVEKLEGEMEENDLEPSSRMTPALQFTICRPSGIVPLTTQGISKSFQNKQVLKEISFEVAKGEKIAIIGPNGIGKSTLLKIIVGDLNSDEGVLKWGYETHFAYFPQESSVYLNGDWTVLEWLEQAIPDTPQEQLRDALAKTLFFRDDVEKKVSSLSGGEASRLILAKILLQKHNVLIFDEPTNHLDMESIEELTKALKAYHGTLILVSHNAYFVSEIADRILEVTLEGVRDFKGSYPEYVRATEHDYFDAKVSLKKRYSKEYSSEQREDESLLPLKKEPDYEERKKLRNKRSQIKAFVQTLESECGLLETELKKVDHQFNQENFYLETPIEKQQELALHKLKIEKKLEELFSQWEEKSLELQELGYD